MFSYKQYARLILRRIVANIDAISVPRNHTYSCSILSLFWFALSFMSFSFWQCSTYFFVPNLSNVVIFVWPLSSVRFVEAGMFSAATHIIYILHTKHIKRLLQCDTARYVIAYMYQTQLVLSHISLIIGVRLVGAKHAFYSGSGKVSP